MLELIAEAFQKSLIHFLDDTWRQDFHEFNFILDAKLPAKMAAGEKFLNDVIVPTLGSRPGTSIIAVDTWRHEPIHPFHAKYSVADGRVAGRDVGDGIDLKLVFEHGLQFEPSHERAGLQLVDAVAYTVRRAVLDPDHRTVQRAYDAIRPKLRKRTRRVADDHAAEHGRGGPALAGALPATLRIDSSVLRAHPTSCRRRTASEGGDPPTADAYPPQLVVADADA